MFTGDGAILFLSLSKEEIILIYKPRICVQRELDPNSSLTYKPYTSIQP